MDVLSLSFWWGCRNIGFVLVVDLVLVIRWSRGGVLGVLFVDGWVSDCECLWLGGSLVGLRFGVFWGMRRGCTLWWVLVFCG